MMPPIKQKLTRHAPPGVGKNTRLVLAIGLKVEGDIVSVQVIASDMITSFHQALCVLILSNM
jgi:hypothetical protein